MQLAKSRAVQLWDRQVQVAPQTSTFWFGDNAFVYIPGATHLYKLNKIAGTMLVGVCGLGDAGLERCKGLQEFCAAVAREFEVESEVLVRDFNSWIEDATRDGILKVV